MTRRWNRTQVFRRRACYTVHRQSFKKCIICHGRR